MCNDPNNTVLRAHGPVYKNLTTNRRRNSMLTYRRCDYDLS